MLNKGLEVIEAHYLFHMPVEKIHVTIHPQSVVHSMVEFEDGAVLAQMGNPDMRGPIGYAMGYPHRLDYQARPLDFAAFSQLTFQAPDLKRYPCLGLALEAIRAGGTAPVILNGANEVAVAAFLMERIPFGAIAETVEKTPEPDPDRAGAFHWGRRMRQTRWPGKRRNSFWRNKRENRRCAC